MSEALPLVTYWSLSVHAGLTAVIQSEGACCAFTADNEGDDDADIIYENVAQIHLLCF